EPDTRWEGAAAAAQASSSGEVRPGFAWRRISELELPWRRAYPDSAARARALARYAERVLGFTPLATIDIDVPLAGVSGVAFVLPSAVAPGGGGAHRVYVKRMLVGTRVAGLLPDWAFFVRCVIDGSLLRPTASREQLYDDDVLLATREAITRTVRDWLLRTLQAGGMTAKEFVQAHHLAIRSLALTDDEMLDVALDVLPFETTAGPATLREVEHEHGVVVYAPLLEQFRRIAPVARARGLAVVNGGYVYDSDLLGRLAQRHPDRFRTLTAADLAQVFAVPTPERELATLDAVDRAREVLAPLECEPQLRVFEPDTVPTVLLTDRDGEYQRELQRTVEESDDVWSEVLAGFARPAAPRRLMFNDACPLVRELLEAPVGEVMDAGVRALYVSAIQLSGEPLRPRDAALMTEAMTVLLRQGLAASRSRRPGDGSATGPGADGR
ncbi:MAG: HSP90 family protein, partial [Micrococcales bacterium]|nr:HSP90 family protein [Micrococcales bacterium]